MTSPLLVRRVSDTWDRLVPEDQDPMREVTRIVVQYQMGLVDKATLTDAVDRVSGVEAMRDHLEAVVDLINHGR